MTNARSDPIYANQLAVWVGERDVLIDWYYANPILGATPVVVGHAAGESAVARIAIPHAAAQQLLESLRDELSSGDEQDPAP